MSPSVGMTIGQVVDALSEDFPDLTISKIRFLEDKGLLRPERTPSGYRMFTPQDVERVRFILVSQRERFWPLRVIADALDQMDRGLIVDPEASAQGRPAPPPRGSVPAVVTAQQGVPEETSQAGGPALPAPEIQLSREELARVAEVGAPQVDALVSFGLVRPDHQGWFSGADARIARAAGKLGARGLEPRHLRAFRLAADRELAVVEQAMSATSASERVAERQRVVAECLALHEALLEATSR